MIRAQDKEMIIMESGYEATRDELQTIEGVKTSVISSDFTFGDNLKMGHFNTIQKNVKVGNNVDIQNYVLLKPGTTIGNNCYIDSYVLSSGDCQIGNNVILRYQSVIARNVIIEDDVFFTAGVKTIFLDHTRTMTPKPLLIKSGSFFGDNVVIMGGITVAENSIFGACAFVNQDTEPNGVYVGTPAKRIRDVTLDEIESMKNS
jgi:UDP-2-acetamido-3-amino-2,3-dideoxy-glucuronate N-acetyltransferase